MRMMPFAYASKPPNGNPSILARFAARGENGGKAEEESPFPWVPLALTAMGRFCSGSWSGASHPICELGTVSTERTAHSTAPNVLPIFRKEQQNRDQDPSRPDRESRGIRIKIRP